PERAECLGRVTPNMGRTRDAWRFERHAMRRDGTTPRLLGLLGLLAVLAVLVAQAAIGVPVDGVVTERRAVAATPPLPAWPAGRPGSYTLRYNDSQWSVAEAPRRRMVALNAWEWPAIGRIKAA